MRILRKTFLAFRTFPYQYKAFLCGFVQRRVRRRRRSAAHGWISFPKVRKENLQRPGVHDDMRRHKGWTPTQRFSHCAPRLDPKDARRFFRRMPRDPSGYGCFTASILASQPKSQTVTLDGWGGGGGRGRISPKVPPATPGKRCWTPRSLPRYCSCSM